MLARIMQWLWAPRPTPDFDAPPRTSMWVWALLAGILVWGGVKFLAGWGEWYIGGDEGVYYQMAVTSPDRAAPMIRGNAHPPLYPYALRAMAAVDPDMDALRVHAVFAALLLIPLAFLLGRFLGGDGSGIITALLVATSPGVIALAPVMRPYTTHLVLLVFALWMLWRYFDSRRRLHVGLYALSMTLALLVHYSTFAILGGVGIFLIGCLLLRRLDKRQVVELLTVHAAIAGVAALLYVFHISRLVGSDIQAEAQTGWLKTQFVQSPHEAYLGLRKFAEYVFGRHRMLPVLLLLVAVVFARRRGRGFALATVAALGVALVFSAARQYPFGGTRHSLYLLAVFAPAAGVGVGCFFDAPRRVFHVAGIAICAFLIVAMVRHYTPEHVLPERMVSHATADDVRAHLHGTVQAGDLVLFDAQTSFVLWPMMRNPGPPLGIPETRAHRIDSDAPHAYVQAGTWYLTGTPDDPRDDRTLLALLDALDRADAKWTTRGRRIWLFQGGWGVPLARRLPETTASGAPVRGAIVGGPGLCVTEIHVDGYRELMTR